MNRHIREELGDYSSIVCLKSIITGMEDSLGEKATAIALVAAGRARGREIAKQLKLCQSTHSLEDITRLVADVLGINGTRLLILDKIEEIEDGYRVYTRETVCSAGELDGSSRTCTFTLGAVQGVIEFITGYRLRGRHTESVLRGGSHDVFEYSIIKRTR